VAFDIDSDFAFHGSSSPFYTAWDRVDSLCVALRVGLDAVAGTQGEREGDYDTSCGTRRRAENITPGTSVTGTGIKQLDGSALGGSREYPWYGYTAEGIAVVREGWRTRKDRGRITIHVEGPG
jgi:hypothetical protein